MKSLTFSGSASLAAIGLALLAVPFVQAQEPVRVVRLSRVEGKVLVAHSGRDVWEEAVANLPLLEGDALATQGGLAEAEFENGATAFLAENSTLQFTRVGFSGAGRATELTLTQGAGTYYANLTAQDTFRVKTSTFDVVMPERAEFRVDAFQDGAAVQVLLGNVSISTTKGSTNLEKGQSVAIHEKDFQDLDNIARLPEEDDFDRWVTEEGEIIRSGNKNTLSYINSPNYYGLSDLSIYGTWINLPGFGLSWRPYSVGLSWTPYLNGTWTLDPRLGWIWVSNEAWGWMPYHFGSWLLSPTLGWIWVPGGSAGLRQWQPARVNWVRAGNQVGNRVGWVAMSPNDREGAPANIAQGVVTKPDRAPLNGISPNEIVTGKGLQNVTLLKQPPQELAVRPGPAGPGVVGSTHSGVQSTIRIAPWTLNNNPSIVYDHRTRTYVNRDSEGTAERDSRRTQATTGGSQLGNASLPPVTPSTVVPRPGSQTQIPRVTIPSTMAPGSRINRVILPPPYPTTPASRNNIPANRIPPVQPPAVMPAVPQRPGAPPANAPMNSPVQPRGNFGNAVTPPSPAPRSATPPPAPPQRPATKDQR